MTKLFKKLFISIISVIAIVCLGASMLFTVQGAKADDSALSITKVEKVYMHGYNSIDSLGYRSEYNVTFNQDIFNDTIQNGAIVASTHSNIAVNNKLDDMHTLLTTMTINGTTLSSITGGAAITKIANNMIKIYTGRPYGYAEFAFPATTIGGKTLTAATFYENQDWTFSTTAPTEFKIAAAFERPVGSHAYTWISVWFNKKVPNYNNAEAAVKSITMTANGQAVDCYYGYGNDWDAGTKYYNFHFQVKNSSFDGEAPFVITFPQGWNYSNDDNYALAQKQQFAIGEVDRDWIYLNQWIDVNNVLEISNIEKTSTSTDTFSTYEISFNSTSDLFAEYTVAQDITSVLKQTNFFDCFKINGTALSTISSSVDINVTKTAQNKVAVKVNQYYLSTSITIESGLRIFGKTSIGKESYSLGSDIARTTLVDIVKLDPITSYGLNAKDNKTRFTIYLSNLGMFAEYAPGTELTAYAGDEFYKNILVNGRTLYDIKNVQKRAVNIYLGNKDIKEIKSRSDNHLYDFDYDNCIEVVISSCCLFDYDVEIKEAFEFGDLYLDETSIYHLNYCGQFEKVENYPTDYELIAIREIPYGVSSAHRAIRLVFNKSISLNVDVTNFIHSFTFNGKTATYCTNPSTDDQTLYITGGRYFNPEIEYGGRSYSIYVNTSGWMNLLKSENPTIVIPETALKDGNVIKGATFKFNNGEWLNANYTGKTTKPAFVGMVHPGNQSNDQKLIRLETNVAFDHWNTSSFLKENIYINGVKATSMSFGAGYCGPETQWDCRDFSIYVNDNLRNYETGIDVIYIPKGCPLSGARMIMEDTYIYLVQSKDERDGAGNWKWIPTFEMPALETAKTGEIEVDDETTTIAIAFDRIVALNDVRFGVYKDIDVDLTKLVINAKTLESLGDDVVSASWVDGAIVVELKNAVIDSQIINVEFIDGFTTPLGYTFAENETLSYSIDDEIWAESFDKDPSAQFASNKIVAIHNPKAVANGYRIRVEFEKPVVGETKMEGSSSKYVFLRNITASYAELIELTDRSNASMTGAAGYDYAQNVIQKFIDIDIQNSFLDKLSINGETLRSILAKETAYVALENYPLSIDLYNNYVDIMIQSDSVIYSTVKDGFYLTFESGLVFEANSKVSSTSSYRYNVTDDGANFAEFAFNKSISLTYRQQSIYKGNDIDLTKIFAKYVLSNGELGDSIQVTKDMLSGFDKDKVGKQTVTLTVDGLTATFEVEVIELPVVDTPDTETEVGLFGCFGNFGTGNAMLVFLAVALVFVTIIYKKKRD